MITRKRVDAPSVKFFFRSQMGNRKLSLSSFSFLFCFCFFCFFSRVSSKFRYVFITSMTRLTPLIFSILFVNPRGNITPQHQRCAATTRWKIKKTKQKRVRFISSNFLPWSTNETAARRKILWWNTRGWPASSSSIYYTVSQYKR